MAYPVEYLAASLYHAINAGLAPNEYPEVEFTERPDPATGSRRRETGRTTMSRPHAEQCDVSMFRQTWASTALGFGGLGGQAITNAYTVVVIGPRGDACVYFSGRLAYRIEKPNAAFHEDLRDQRMARRAESGRYERSDQAGQNEPER